jgi:hypothetical protein
MRAIIRLLHRACPGRAAYSPKMSRLPLSEAAFVYLLGLVLIATLGRVPHFISADKGMSYTDCFEWSVERGITLAAPYRKANGVAPDMAQPTVHLRTAFRARDRPSIPAEVPRRRLGGFTARTWDQLRELSR